MRKPNDCHFVLCRSREETAAGRRAFEEELLRRLPAGHRVTVVPHVYDLAVDGPAFGRLRSLAGPLVVLAWLPERATFWLLRRGGIDGTLATAQDDNSDSKRIWCIDLRRYEGPEACAGAVGRLTGSVAGGDAAAVDQTPDIEYVGESVRTRWFPVIDYARCRNCLECLNFCLFGVYGLDAAETVRVEQPDACRPGCPACARVCPNGAIMFPEHADPVISGGALGEPDGPADAPSSPPRPTIPTPPPHTPVPGTDSLGSDRRSGVERSGASETRSRLDDLVDELDEFDR